MLFRQKQLSLWNPSGELVSFGSPGAEDHGSSSEALRLFPRPSALTQARGGLDRHGLAGCGRSCWVHWLKAATLGSGDLPQHVFAAFSSCF